MPLRLLITSCAVPDTAPLTGDPGTALLVGEGVTGTELLAAHDLGRAAAFYGPHGARVVKDAPDAAGRLAALLAADQRIVAARAEGAVLEAVDHIAAEALTLDLDLDGPAAYRDARVEALRLVYADRAREAEALVRSRLERIRRPRVRADLLGEVVWAQLARGERSGLVLEATAAALLMADRHHAADRSPPAARAFYDALRLAYHRGLHLDATSSPLAERPEDFAAVFGASVVARSVSGVDVPRTRRPVASAANRVLIVTWHNDNFLGEIMRSLEDEPDVEVRFVALADLPDTAGLSSPVRLALSALNAPVSDPDPVAWVETHLRADLEWADTIMLEWCTAASALVSRVDLGRARVVIRLHSGEVFLHWPQLVNWSRVDEVVFVSEHLRDHAARSIPGLQGGAAPRLSVAPLTVDLDRFPSIERADEVRFVLGMVGWSAIAKDVRWALELLVQLRAHDPRFRLRLVGTPLGEGASPAGIAYGRSVRALLDPLLAAGAVEVVDQTDDVAGVLEGVGFIISTSVRESFHAALLEGAATGAAPLVRDWPYFAGRAHGARSVYPAEWVVADHDEAVRRILALVESPEEWRRFGDAAAHTARALHDPGASLAAYRRLLLGDRR